MSRLIAFFSFSVSFSVLFASAGLLLRYNHPLMLSTSVLLRCSLLLCLPSHPHDDDHVTITKSNRPKAHSQ